MNLLADLFTAFVLGYLMLDAIPGAPKVLAFIGAAVVAVVGFLALAS